MSRHHDSSHHDEDEASPGSTQVRVAAKMTSAEKKEWLVSSEGSWEIVEGGGGGVGRNRLSFVY
jgi:hypothetical protein